MDITTKYRTSDLQRANYWVNVINTTEDAIMDVKAKGIGVGEDDDFVAAIIVSFEDLITFAISNLAEVFADKDDDVESAYQNFIVAVDAVDNGHNDVDFVITTNELFNELKVQTNKCYRKLIEDDAGRSF